MLPVQVTKKKKRNSDAIEADVRGKEGVLGKERMGAMLEICIHRHLQWLVLQKRLLLYELFVAGLHSGLQSYELSWLLLGYII